jgi:hypothetical protein
MIGADTLIIVFSPRQPGISIPTPVLVNSEFFVVN